MVIQRKKKLIDATNLLNPIENMTLKDVLFLKNPLKSVIVLHLSKHQWLKKVSSA